MSPSQHSKTKKERKCSMNPFMKTSSLVTKKVEIPTAEKRLLCKIPLSTITKRTIQYSLHTWLHPFSPKPIRSPPVFGTLVSIFFFIECFFFPLFFFVNNGMGPCGSSVWWSKMSIYWVFSHWLFNPSPSISPIKCRLILTFFFHVSYRSTDIF